MPRISIPFLSAEARRDYHDTTINQRGLEAHIARLQKAEALVVQFPTWCFGMPAMLKGYFDRLVLPGVAFDLTDPADVKPMLGNIRRIARHRHLWAAALDEAILHGR